MVFSSAPLPVAKWISCCFYAVVALQPYVNYFDHLHALISLSTTTTFPWMTFIVLYIWHVMPKTTTRPGMASASHTLMRHWNKPWLPLHLECRSSTTFRIILLGYKSTCERTICQGIKSNLPGRDFLRARCRSYHQPTCRSTDRNQSHIVLYM